MIQVDSIDQANGKWVNDQVQLLTEPRLDAETGQWTALANAYGMLAIVELKVTQQTQEMNHG